jgi:hypothetical protein
VAALKPIYTHPTVEAAKSCLDEFTASELGTRYPAAVATQGEHVGEIHPVFSIPAGPSTDHLYDQRYRVVELPVTKSYQEPGPFPKRYCRGEAVVAHDLQH